MIKSLSDLEVYHLSFQLAMDVFTKTQKFPKEEKYSLTDQVIRSSRSIAANIAEGRGKRIYENEFKKHIVYAMGSLEETKVWIRFAKSCDYIDDSTLNSLMISLDHVGAKIFTLYKNWKTL